MSKNTKNKSNKFNVDAFFFDAEIDVDRGVVTAVTKKEGLPWKSQSKRWKEILKKSASKAEPLPNRNRKQDVNTQKYPELIAIEMFFDYFMLFNNETLKKSWDARTKLDTFWNNLLESRKSDIEFVSRMTKIYRVLNYLTNSLKFKTS